MINLSIPKVELHTISDMERRLQQSFPNAQVRMWDNPASLDLHMEVSTEESVRTYIYDKWKGEWILRSCVLLKYDHHEALTKHKKVMQERRDRKCSHRNL